ncbi:beta-N-acetylhexosaminidase family protein [Paracoccus kondratievae]|uniref:hypothetical protein n=1 Tax=Paracoccus kondratievae TaxID=135740 RepID=UPI0018795E12|nr:hypothetical protein [Paracoccus kondratievae]
MERELCDELERLLGVFEGFFDTCCHDDVAVLGTFFTDIRNLVLGTGIFLGGHGFWIFIYQVNQ